MDKLENRIAKLESEVKIINDLVGSFLAIAIPVAMAVIYLVVVAYRHGKTLP